MVKTRYGNSSLQTDFKHHDSVLYEILLMEIRKITISYSPFKIKRNDIEKALIKEINDIEHFSDIVDNTYLKDKIKQHLKINKKKHYMVAFFDLGQNG